jgi:putative SOS response-associated peptidase YedK
VCGSALCNLYTLTKGQAAIRDWFRARHDHTGNLPLFASIFPGQMAPIVRNGTNGARELVMARWGMPGPPPCGGQPVTNIRNGMFPATSTRPRASLALTGSCR